MCLIKRKIKRSSIEGGTFCPHTSMKPNAAACVVHKHSDTPGRAELVSPAGSSEGDSEDWWPPAGLNKLLSQSFSNANACKYHKCAEWTGPRGLMYPCNQPTSEQCVCA